MCTVRILDRHTLILVDSLAADINLMLIDVRAGRPVVDNARCDYATSAAVLCDLESQGRIAVSGKGRFARTRTVRVLSMRPVGEPVTDSAVRNLVGRPRTIREIMYRYGYLWRQSAYAAMAADEILRFEPRRIWSLSFTERWKIVNAEAYDKLCGDVARVLLDEAEPNSHLTTLIALLHQVSAVARLFPDNRKDARRRAADIAQRLWAGDALRKALDQRRRAMVMLNPHNLALPAPQKPQPGIRPGAEIP